MKKLNFLQGMRALTLTGLVCFVSLGVSAQTKTKTSTTAVQTKAKTASAAATPTKTKSATVATAKPKTATTASTQRKTMGATAATQKKNTAPTVATVTPAKPIEASEPVTTAPESRVEVKRQASAAFEGGTNVIGVSFGLVDNLDYSGSGASTLKPLTFSYERGLNVSAGPGVIGVGGLFSYSHLKWAEDYKISVMYIAAKGTYHYNFVQNDKIDTYAGLTLGYARSKVNFDDTFAGDYDASEGEVKVGFLVGGRYFFTDNVGAHLELETGPMSHVSIGLNYKF